MYLIHMYKEDLALNNQQWLTCHKTKPNKSEFNNPTEAALLLS